MTSKVNIQIEKTAVGYVAYSPDLEGGQFEGDSLESLVDVLKRKLDQTLAPSDPPTAQTHQPIWAIAQNLTQTMTDDEIAQLPQDGAVQHDHYIYGTAKRPE